MKILVLLPEGEVRDRFFTQENRRRLESLGTVTWNELGRHYTRGELWDALPETDVIVTGWGTPGVEGACLGEGGCRKLLAHMGGSIAPYVNRQAFERGLKVTCVNEIFAGSVAEGTLAYILAALRQIPYWDGVVKSGGWRGDSFRNVSLMKKRVGIVGYGAVSRKLMRLLKPFEPEILLYSSHLEDDEYEKLGADRASLEEIFSHCDVISLHSSMNAGTRGMVNEELLGRIKPGALFVNTARGALTDERALERMLREGRFYAVLDVYREEPLPQDAGLRSCPNAILMPHMAGPAADLYEVCGEVLVEEIARFVRGDALRYGVEAAAADYMTAGG